MVYQNTVLFPENHLLDFNSFEFEEFIFESQAFLHITKQFEEHQACVAGNLFVDIMHTKPCADTTSVFGKYPLYFFRIF